MIFPTPINPGDTIGLIAPCSPVDPSRALLCKEFIESMGYSVIMGESTRSSLHGYLAGSDSIRANDINSMFVSPKIQAIFCLRGGYGSNRLMDLIDFPAIQKNPKIFVGYSDVTTLHLAFHRLCKFVTFHGPMVSSNMLDDFDEYSANSFRKTIQMKHCLPFHNPTSDSMHIISHGCGCGELIGGCLSLVSSCIGTYYQPDFRGKILFLEDINESLPRCDKMIEQLFHCGIMDQINGLLLGEFVNCNNESDPSYHIENYFLERLGNLHKPVVSNIKSGHCKPTATLPMGCLCKIDTSRQALSFFRS